MLLGVFQTIILYYCFILYCVLILFHTIGDLYCCVFLYAAMYHRYMRVVSGPKLCGFRKKIAKPYCKCWDKSSAPLTWNQLSACSCGEEHDDSEWSWQQPDCEGPSWIVLSNNQKQVTFHPFYSSGTAAVRGDKPLSLNNHYYWEVKILTDTYGTDVMVGVGTNKVNMFDSRFTFTSFLGRDAESYGLSYSGALKHNAVSTHNESAGFCRGSIVGVRLDLWSGTLEFYINRIPQGVSFYNLRRHSELYPMLCSTAAQSSMRLISTASWKASLLVDAVKILAASVNPAQKPKLPPGLLNRLRNEFWLTLSTEGCILDEDEEMNSKTEVTSSEVTRNVLNEVLPSQYANGYYVDNVSRNYRVVVWQ